MVRIVLVIILLWSSFDMFSDVNASDLEGLVHCITAPAWAHRNLSLDDDDSIIFYRSMTERKTAGQELKLDRRLEREKVSSRITCR